MRRSMQLTGFTEYGLLVLACTLCHPGERVTVRQIGAALNILRDHLMKVVHAPERPDSWARREDERVAFYLAALLN